MPPIKLSLRPGYYNVWDSSWLYTNRQALINYVHYAIKSKQFHSAEEAESEGYVASKMEIRGTVGEILYDSKRHPPTFFFPPGPIEIPKAVQFDINGNIRFTDYKSMGFWNAFVSTFGSMTKGPLFKIFAAIVMPSFFTRVPLGKKIMDSVNWASDKLNRLTTPWIQKIDTAFTSFNEFMVNFKWRFELPFNNLMASFYNTWKPLIIKANTTANALSKTYNNIKTTQDKIVNTLNNPIITFEENIVIPYNVKRRKIEQQIGDIADFLYVFGINEGKKVQNWTNSVFKSIGEWKIDPLTKYKKLVLNIETTFENFRDTVFGPVQKTVNRISPIVDNVNKMFESLGLEDARMRKTPLRKTLEYSPELVVDFEEGNQSYEVIDYAYQPIKIPETLPEVEWWSKSIDEADEILYVDDNDVPLQKAITPDGRLSDNPDDFPGKVKKVSELVRHPSEKNTQELTAINSLWSIAVDKAEILDISVPVDEPKKFELSLAKDLGLVILPFGWLYYFNYEYTLQSIEAAVNYPDELREYNHEMAKMFWEAVQWWADYKPELKTGEEYWLWE